MEEKRYLCRIFNKLNEEGCGPLIEELFKYYPARYIRINYDYKSVQTRIRGLYDTVSIDLSMHFDTSDSISIAKELCRIYTIDGLVDIKALRQAVFERKYDNEWQI